MEIHHNTSNPFLTEIEFEIVYAIWGGVTTPSGIAKHLDIPRANVRYHLNKLIERDIVRKTRGKFEYECVSSNEKLMTVREARRMLDIIRHKLDVKVEFIRYKSNDWKVIE